MKTVLQFLARERLWPLLVAVVGALLILPGLGSNGMWEPYEIRIADRAGKKAGLDATTDSPTAKANSSKAKSANKANKKKTADDVRPPLTEWSIGRGMKMFDSRSLGARLPLAVLALLAMLATFFLGRRLASPRAGLLSAFILVSFPLFLFQSRQLMSAMGAIAGSAFVVLGLVGLAWPVGSRPSSRDEATTARTAVGLFGARTHAVWMYAVDASLVAFGAVISYYSAAALLGIVVPFGAVALACLGALIGNVHLERDRACAAGPGDPYGRQIWLAMGLVTLTVTTCAAIVMTFVVEPTNIIMSLIVVPAMLGIALVAYGLGHRDTEHKLSPEARWRQWHLLIAGLVTLAIASTALFIVLGQVFELKGLIPGERALFGHTIMPVDQPLDVLGGQWKLRPDDKATFDTIFEQIAFGLFPWVILAPIAVAHLAMGIRRGRIAWAGYVLFCWATLGWVIATILQRKMGAVLFPALVPIAIAIGVWLDGLLDARNQADATTESELGARAHFGLSLQMPLVALFVALATVALSANILAFPDKFLSINVIGETISYPKGTGTELLKIKLSLWVVILGGAVGGLLAVGLLLWKTHKRLAQNASSTFTFRRSVFGLYYFRRYGIHAAIGAGLVFALFLAQVWTPKLSRQLSSKGIFAKYHALRASGDELGLMGKYGSAPNYYIDGDYESLRDRNRLIQFLRKSNRVFALVPAAEQCALQRSLKKQDPYYVLDRNAKTLLLSNQLKSGENNINPLEGVILKEAPAKVDKSMSVNFDNRVELIGVDMPTAVGRGNSFEMTMYFRVLKPISGKWKIFVHFDGRGGRFQGDHEPIDGLCSTSHWQPGDYIVDTFKVTAGNMTYNKMVYNVHVGFFQGSHGNWRNMAILSASGEQGKMPIGKDKRVQIGQLRVK